MIKQTSDKKVPFSGHKKTHVLDGHTLHTMNIHNPYGSTNCIRFEGIISAPYGAPLCYFGDKDNVKDWDYVISNEGTYEELVENTEKLKNFSDFNY